MHDPARIRRRLLAWYDAHRRDLPWRKNRDPYRVWLSEIMLQQTTVAHATPYFAAFTTRWPTVSDLADADDAEVMAAWAGLGYYARARNLLACARAIVAEFGGAFPGGKQSLETLPGVGPYTAAAIAAISFGEPANAVDANVERVMARLFATESPLPASRHELAERAGRFVRPERAGDWPQALMDLGATVCTPAAPACHACPLKGDCLAYGSGAPAQYPRRAVRSAKPRRWGESYVLAWGDKVALERRPPRGLLGGMLALPSSPWRTSAAPASASETFAGPWRRIGAVEHAFTHFSLSLEVFAGRTRDRSERFLWMDAAQAEKALPTVFRKALVLYGRDGAAAD